MKRDDAYARTALTQAQVGLARGHSIMANAIDELLAEADHGVVPPHTQDALRQVQTDLVSLTDRARYWMDRLDWMDRTGWTRRYWEE